MADVANLDHSDPQLTLCNALVEAAANSLRGVAQLKGLALHVDAGADDLMMHIDRRALGRIVLHLVDNAIRFTESGGVRVGVARGVREARKTIEISVADTGAGIRPGEPSPLERPGSALQRSQQLAMSLGGRIEMSSTPGYGTTFTLVLLER